MAQLRWVCVQAARHLVPVLVAMLCLFIADAAWARVLGLLIVLALVGRTLLDLRATPRAEGPGEGAGSSW